jgi:uncharacterized protein GlcG (DUF336 family)
MFNRHTIAAATLFLASACAAQAPAPPGPRAGGPPGAPARGPSLGVALAMAQAAIAECKARGATISVSVVDSAGLAKVTLAADGSPGLTATSVRKGATAVAFKAPGSELEQREKTDKEFAAKIAANPKDYNDHAGSVLLKVGGEIIGAIGVGGASSHDIDDACAHAGADKLR